MTDELKPCPFCGGQESLMNEHLEGTIRHPSYRIRCDNCGASTGYTDKDCFKDWNTRAATQQQSCEAIPCCGKCAAGKDVKIEYAAPPHPTIDRQAALDALDSLINQIRPFSFEEEMKYTTIKAALTAPVPRELLEILQDVLENMNHQHYTTAQALVGKALAILKG